MGHLTCYKLCYALGVSTNALNEDFPVVHRICKDTRAFAEFDSLWKVRAYSSVITAVINDLDNCMLSVTHTLEVTEKAIWTAKLFGSESEVDLGQEILLTPDVLISWLNEMRNRRASHLSQAWDTLGCAIPKSVFMQCMEYPEFTTVTVKQHNFMKEKRNPKYGLQFYGKEVLNVAMGSMLQDDASLRTRLSLFCGFTLKPFRDRSKFGQDFVKYLEHAKLTKEDICNGRPLYVMAHPRGIKAHELALQETLDLLLWKQAQELEHVEHDQLTKLPKGSLIFVPDVKWAIGWAQLYSDKDFAVALPVESRFYKKLRRRIEPNVYYIEIS